MPQWGTFAGLTGVVLTLLLVLSYLTQTAFDERSASDAGRDEAGSRDRDAAADRRLAADRDDSSGPDPERVRDADVGFAIDAGCDSGSDPGPDPDSDPSARTDAALERDGVGDPARAPAVERRAEPARLTPESLSTGELLANVALSQGVFAGLLIGAALYTGIPAEALGIEFTREYLVAGLAVGAGLGFVLYVANELGATAAKRVGLDADETLRRLLAPETTGGWLVLLLVVLPIIAAFEELLFRAALIGAPATGFGVSPWLLAVGSSLAFGVGHGMQGRVGIVVTGALGFVLAAAFIVTESLLVVIVAHYLINALEFVVHEGLGLEWAEVTGS